MVGRSVNSKPKYFKVGLSVIIVKIENTIYHKVMCPKDADGMANSVDSSGMAFFFRR